MATRIGDVISRRRELYQSRTTGSGEWEPAHQRGLASDERSRPGSGSGEREATAGNVAAISAVADSCALLVAIVSTGRPARECALRGTSERSFAAGEQSAGSARSVSSYHSAVSREGLRRVSVFRDPSIWRPPLVGRPLQRWSTALLSRQSLTVRDLLRWRR